MAKWPSFDFIIKIIDLIILLSIILFGINLLNLSKFSFAELQILERYFEATLAFGSIFVPIVFLIFFDLIRKSDWKLLHNSKGLSEIFLILLFVSVTLLFVALSWAAKSTINAMAYAIFFAYLGDAIAAVVLLAVAYFTVKIEFK